LARTKKRPDRNASQAFTPVVPADPDQLAAELAHMGAHEAANLVESWSDALALDVLARVNPSIVTDVMHYLDPDRRASLMSAGPSALTAQWRLNETFADDTVGRLMEPPTGVFAPTVTVGDASDKVRQLVKKIFITYCFVTDGKGALLGIVTMRDLLVADDSAKLADVMLKNPFALKASTPLMDAMKQVLNRHFPVYPVVDDNGKLIGLVRGQAMFEAQAIEISAQAGTMVGVDKEERLVTPWPRSLKFRHPWLQLNLLTAFLAAFVVGIFQDTIDRIVILAVFLPVLAGQSGNTGCQALAVTLRGMTLGEMKKGSESKLVFKEGWLGFLNGSLVGITAGVGMYIAAVMQDTPQNPFMLAVIVMLAMIGACVTSGISGALIPMTLRRLGFDPATASSIFLTTATDVVSMGLFLTLATLLLL
jgi:magnesium transporter